MNMIQHGVEYQITAHGNRTYRVSFTDLSGRLQHVNGVFDTEQDAVNYIRNCSSMDAFIEKYSISKNKGE